MGLVTRQELDVTVDHCRFGLVDMDAAATASPPIPATGAGWVAAGPQVIYIETTEDVLRARLLVEVWDAPATVDAARWQQWEDVALDLPSGRFGVDETAAGWEPDVFALPSAGRWWARVACRGAATPPTIGTDVANRPPATNTDAAATPPTTDMDVAAADYLLQFWPSPTGPGPDQV